MTLTIYGESNEDLDQQVIKTANRIQRQSHWKKYYKISPELPKATRKQLRELLGQIDSLGVYLLPDNMPLKNYLRSKSVDRNIFKNESYDDIMHYREFLRLVAAQEYKKAAILYRRLDTFPREFICEQFKELLDFVWKGQPYE